MSLSCDEKLIVGETDIELKSLDYYGLTNVTRWYSDAESNGFSDEDIKRFQNQDEEARTFDPFKDNSKVDEFLYSKKKVGNC